MIKVGERLACSNGSAAGEDARGLKATEPDIGLAWLHLPLRPVRTSESGDSPYGLLGGAAGPATSRERLSPPGKA